MDQPETGTATASRLEIHDDVDGLHMWICRFPREEPGGWGAHHHAEHQIIWVSEGLTTAVVGGRTWALPPTRALFVPGGIPHDTVNRPPSVLHCLYVRPAFCPLDWTVPTVIGMTPLLRELALTLAGPGVHVAVEEPARALFFGLVEQVTDPGIAVPLPHDPRARAMALRLVSTPADPRTLEEWAAQLSTSVSTLRRAFVAETGMTFTDWRTQVRLRASLPLLADGLPVAAVARRTGYTSRAGYVDAFRRHYGHSPSAHLRQVSAGGARA